MRTEKKYSNSNWKRLKIAWLFEDISSGTTPSSTNEEYYRDGEIPWVNTGDLTDGKLFSVSKKISRKAIADYPTLKVHSKNSLIVALYGATIGKLAITQFDVTTNQACCVLNKPKNVDINFVFYWFLANREGIIQRAVGGGQKNISQGIIRSLRMDVPNAPLQNKIISFLDQKTSEIDALITDKEKLIRLLEEKRQAIITEAVTKGLDPDVKMKDSGVEWIGEIPEHWKMRKAKYIFKQINEKNYPEEKLLSVLKGKGLLLRSELEFKAVMAFKGLENFKLVREGDFVIHLRSFQSGFEMSSLQGIVSPAYTVFRASIELDNNYFKYVFYSQYFIDYIGSTTQSLRDGKPIAYDDFSSSYLMFPPEKEQKEISDYLASLCKEMDKAKELIQKQLLKLKEYRQALIYEAVTGKIDVQEMLKETEQEEVSSS
ncbi:restriction endonuclease subunit S [Salinicoccus halitifaciens]|uniref:Type I restriction enzyme S subunit n=1 Tax=Salinicoccus halitifaciens TaxID=1073415 RepID=A0ABV2EB07_9STAP|nr:restriction endonuclease subunit S [Salinicoccus halitifaciens]MCD2137562.1 restriction endonuclease subunit S [Salinicoccus halitifaciens]